MAQVFGYLRDDQATHGEKLVLGKLRTSLPQDFCVYVECPLHDGNIERMPDFIVLSNFGVVVLEVKDWVQIVKADRFYAHVRTRSGRIDQHRNPVGVARDFATILTQKLESIPQLLGSRHRCKVPWGYAVVLPNLPSSVITQLRRPWGKAQVLGLGDLESHTATRRLKATVPRNYTLHRDELGYIKAVINPAVLIAPQADRLAIVLDDQQEEIVVEDPRTAPDRGVKPELAQAEQEALFVSPPSAPQTALKETPSIVEAVTHNVSIRLVRGVAGSGKTLVLTQRARYLAAKHPEWQVCVLTFNNRLADSLSANLKGIPNLKVRTFHGLCTALLKDYMGWKSPSAPQGWLQNRLEQWPIVQEMGVDFVRDEIMWIKETDVQGRDDYLNAERKGRSLGLRRSGRQRQQIYDVYDAYNTWLAAQDTYDWADVPYLVMRGMDETRIQAGCYDAILIDEAQDFAPVWFRVIQRLLKPDGGVIFLTDDPAQSIYRFYSWREKGIPVMGRTRWLRVPYRNTRQIYQAAYEVIREDEVLKRNLEDQLGTPLEPDLSSIYLRSGPRPSIREFRSLDDELTFARSEIEYLLQQGLDPRQIIVLHRRKPGARKIEQHLRGLDVEVSTFHAPKGLEYRAVFLSQMQYTFPGEVARSEEALSGERRLVYMAMTRAREHLYLNYEGHWPTPLESVRQYADQVFA